MKQLLLRINKQLAVWAAAVTLLLGITAAVVPQTADAFSFFQSEATVAVNDLPREAQATLALIKAGGPFPYAKDGTVFGNYERILPRQKRGYYTEYTVKTPGLRNRGPRRIIAGKGTTGDPATSGEYWYTADHYQSFRRIKER